MSIGENNRSESGDWKLATIRDVFTVVGGGTPATEKTEYWNGKIPWISSADIDENHKIRVRRWISEEAIRSSATNLVPRGSVVVATRVGLGKVAEAPEDLCFSQDNQALLFDRKVLEPQFVVHQLSKTVQVFRHISRGTTINGVTKKQLLDLEFAMPPIARQRKIVAEIEKQFTRLEAGVTALKRVQANLKRYRAAVLKAACEGKLVPTEAYLQRSACRAEALGRRREVRGQKSEVSGQPAAPKRSGEGGRSGAGVTTPDFESGTILLQRILAERRRAWEQQVKTQNSKHKTYRAPAAPDTAKLPPLPEGWTWATVDQLAEVGSGNTPAKITDYLRSSGPIPWFRVGDMNRPGNERAMLSAENYLSTHSAEELGLKIFPTGTVIFPKRGGAIATNKKRILEAPAATDLNVMGLTPHAAIHRYFWWWFVSVDLASLSDGSNVPQVNNQDVLPLLVPLPPSAEQKRIVAEVERRLSVVEELESVVTANLQRAARLRQAILRQAFSGGLVKAEIGAAPIFTVQLSPQSKRRRHFLRVLLSAEIVHQLHAEPTFGQIKHQKVFHLCEHVARLSELDVQYHRDAAGPFDNRLIYANEGDLKRNKWYERIGHHYRPMGKAGDHAKYLVEFSQDQLATIHRLIELMRRWDTKTCEIFSTTYAAWNDLIILQREPTDAAILNEVLNRWHPSKRDIPEKRWRDAIAWMKKEDFAPTGFGRPTTKSG